MKTYRITSKIKLISWYTGSIYWRPRIFCIMLFLIAQGTAYAYTPPIGVPDPGMWGTTHPIDSSAPDVATKCPNWPLTVSTGCYYIDNTHQSATDTSNTQGYPNKPRLTIPSHIIYPVSAYVKIVGGPYNDADYYIKMTIKGTADNPAWIVGDPLNSSAINAQIHLANDSSYVIIENLDFSGGNKNAVALAGTNIHHICLRNLKIHDKPYVGNNSGISAYPASTGTVHDIVIYNSEFYNLGQWDPPPESTTDQDYHGIGINGGATDLEPLYNVWILNNSFHHLGGCGVQIISGETGDARGRQHHIYIGKNVAHHNRQASFWSKQSRDVVMSQNISYAGYNHGLYQTGTGIGFQYGPDNLWIIFNEIYDCETGIRQGSTPAGTEAYNIYMIGNVIHDINTSKVGYDPTNFYRLGQAFHLMNGTQRRHIINNTIYNADGGVNAILSGPLGISNNIFSNIYEQDYFHANMSAQSVTTLDNNLFYDPEGAIRFRWGNVYTSLSAFQSASGQCANCQVGNPLFVDPDNNNFNLQQTTPITTTRHPAYATFESLYGINIDVDYNGNVRPASGAWSVGAFEIGTLKSTTLPVPPAPKPTVNK